MTPSQIEGPTQNRQDPVRSRDVDLPIVDMTGLMGRFDFTWNIEKYVSAMRARIMAEGKPISESDARLVLVQNILAGELKLQLETRKAPVEN